MNVTEMVLFLFCLHNYLIQRKISGSFAFIMTIFVSCRFITEDDEEWFDRNFSRVIEEHVDPNLVPKVQAEPYFVDFLRDMPEPTGEEPEDFVFEAPKIYELVFT